MKSLLLHVQDDSGLETRLQTALDIVRASGGHLTCLHVTPVNAYVGFEPFGGMFVMQDIMKMLDEQETAMAARIEAHLAKEDVSWNYASTTADVSQALISAGSLADMIVMSHLRRGQGAPTIDSLIADVVTGAHTPVLVVPEGRASFHANGSAAIAWNGSFEAANALRAAVPMLKMAKTVKIITVEQEDDSQFPSITASQYLSRHGISSELSSQPATDGLIEDALKQAVARVGADYLVMGAFGHSRAYEYWFGGVTRSMLLGPPLPLIFAR